ncbi:MAG TPA: histidine phosphatase family protein [Candidatus Dormibacteraeota bacterium]|nr:histidine phosphatase family protein [Candidatus Dormibacteraeota bacterium]
MIVWLVRHGEPAWPAGAALGWSDPVLTPAGEAQASAAADRLASRPLSAVHSSDLRRSLLTARRVAARHGLRVSVTSELRELHFGPWEGRSLADLWAEDPDAARAWESDLERTPPQFGESVADLRRRVGSFARRLAAGPGEVAVVAHRGSLAALQSALTGVEFATCWTLGFALGEVREVRPVQRNGGRPCSR